MDETVAIESRSEFALWAIERAKEIVAQEGTALALAARDMDEESLRDAGHKVRFHALSPLTFRLLQRLSPPPCPRGSSQESQG